MNVVVGGGVNEHGRNCFFVESSAGNFLLDCGVMPGDASPYPRLTSNQIKSAKWLFISHSHIDHTGAHDWLCEQGFNGCVIMTKETATQVAFVPKQVCLIDERIPALTSFKLADEMYVVWGKSGQCVGSVWYNIVSAGKRIVFSGDYVEDALVYRCDHIRDITANYAILDSAYGDIKSTPADYRAALIATVAACIEQDKPVMFPVPKYGRGLELLVLFNEYFPNVPVKLDAHLQMELSRMQDFSEWIVPGVAEKLSKINFCNFEKGLIFFSDPQLKSREGQEIAQKIINMNGVIILTGHEDAGSYSERLRALGQAISSRYAVHMNEEERNELEGVNTFGCVIGYHCP